MGWGMLGALQKCRGEKTKQAKHICHPASRLYCCLLTLPPTPTCPTPTLGRRDARTVAAGGATEIEVARQLQAFGRKETGLDQYAIIKYAESLEVVPRTIAENSGLSATEAVAALYAAHAGGAATAGLDVESGAPRDLGAEGGIYDIYTAKWWAIKLATEAAVTVLRIDQIIMAKVAGGPRPRGGGGGGEEDD